MGISTEKYKPYLSLGFGLSLFAVATARSGSVSAGVLPAANAGCYGVNLCIRPALSAIDESGELVQESTGLHRLEVALVAADGAEGSASRLEVLCEPFAGKAFGLSLEPSDRLAALPDATQYDSDVHLDPGTYHFRVTVDRRASADFIVEV